MIDSKTIFIAKYPKSIIKKAIQKVERLKDHHSNSNRKNKKVEFLTDFDDRESVFIDFLKNISKKKSSFANWKKILTLPISTKMKLTFRSHTSF